jgi:hypothetical protein
VRNRDIVVAKMTPVHIAEAHKLAREWEPPSAFAAMLSAGRRPRREVAEKKSRSPCGRI